MARFRPVVKDSLFILPTRAINPETVGWLMGEVLRPGHFYVAPDLHCRGEGPLPEECLWEVFQGRLLDPAHTRQKRTFHTWNLHLCREGECSSFTDPLLSLKLDVEA